MTPTDRPLRWRQFTLHPATREARCGDAPLRLSSREFDLLCALMRAPGQTLSRQALEAEMHPWGSPLGSNAVEVHIHHLRLKLGRQCIQTVRGAGYRLVGAGETGSDQPSG